MDALIAGWAAGYGMALVTMAALTFLVTRLRDTALFQRRVAREVPGALLAVPISLGAMVGWTMVGLVIGAVYRAGGLETQPDALGSPSAPFTAALVIVSLFPLPPLLVVAGRYWWLWLAISAAFAGLFGWLMPVLASQ